MTGFISSHNLFGIIKSKISAEFENRENIGNSTSEVSSSSDLSFRGSLSSDLFSRDSLPSDSKFALTLGQSSIAFSQLLFLTIPNLSNTLIRSPLLS